MVPWLWIVAGPNGAGKSSFAGKFLDALPAAYPQYQLPTTIVHLNDDERTLALRRECPDAAQDALNLRAAQEIDAELVRLIEAGQSVVVETVLSSPRISRRCRDSQSQRAEDSHFELP